MRVYSDEPEQSRRFLEDSLGFEARGDQTYERRGPLRGSLYAYDQWNAAGRGGAGTVHHVAWACGLDQHPAWRQQVLEGGGNPTPIIDRFYFRSIYFREPSGVLFEIATMGPGFAADESIEALGMRLSLPPNFEHLRARLEDVLTPLPPAGRRRPSRD